ncbi:MAG: TfoX/Sxy family protein [Nocardioides sp.]|uniref:TfoX/Sxy family protein n=1 Tax=Nocardioides sp. TaxID=35761 RepID=UPI000C8FABC4|nr:TfoX/Sxy family protein [Nocardioides sp.]MAS54822.1 RNA methyltransferase [Pimelobacter sp.]MDE0778242.1 TfoX/Sxy family protein [Nocardioides sp.]
MAYDPDLAERVRAILAPGTSWTEKAMFGGLAFLVGGNMAVCVSGQGGLLVRLDATTLPRLVAQEHVEAMVMGGRTSRTWVHVDAAALGEDAALEPWVARGLAVAGALPTK